MTISWNALTYDIEIWNKEFALWFPVIMGSTNYQKIVDFCTALEVAHPENVYRLVRYNTPQLNKINEASFT